MTYLDWYRITKNCLYCGKKYSKMGKICYQMDHTFVAVPERASLWFHEYERENKNINITFGIDPYRCYCKIRELPSKKETIRDINFFDKINIDNMIKNINNIYKLMK